MTPKNKIVKSGLRNPPDGGKVSEQDLPALLADIGRRLATLQEQLQVAKRLAKLTTE